MCLLYFNRFIDFCSEQGGYTGLPFTNVEGIEEVEKRLLALNFDDESGETGFKYKPLAVTTHRLT